MNIKELIKSIEKDIDFTGILQTLDQLEKPEVIPFGIKELDDILGIGGIPMGKVTELSGNYGSAKTSLALKLISEAQKKGIRCAFIDAETTLSRELAEKLGVKTEDLLVGTPLSGEEAFELIENLSDKGYKLIIIDSISALLPEAEDEADYNQQTVGIHARMISKAMRKIIGTISRNKTALVAVNQIRETIGFSHNLQKSLG